MYFVDIVMEREIDYELTIATHSPHPPALQLSACKVKYTCMDMYVCMYVCIYIYIYIHMYVYVYIYLIKSCEYRKQKST